jgi:predicted DNA-binding transcriptional regulator YafY
VDKHDAAVAPIPGEPLTRQRLEIDDVDPKFDLKKDEAEAFGVTWGKPMTVVVRFHADQAPYVREREWHPTQKLCSLRDGRVELTFRAGGIYEIIRWVLSWGGAAEVIRPAGLRNETGTILRAASAMYGKPSPKSK